MECLPARLPVLSTPRPHTRQGTGHVSGVAKPPQSPTCLRLAVITMATISWRGLRRPERLLRSPDSNRVLPVFLWLQHCTNRHHAQPFLWKTVQWMSPSSSNQERCEEFSFPPIQSFLQQMLKCYESSLKLKYLLTGETLKFFLIKWHLIFIRHLICAKHSMYIFSNPHYSRTKWAL